MAETLPQRLDRLMREAGYNPRSLALAASLGVTAVRDIIEGRIASPRYTTLEGLAQVLGVTVEQLAAGEGGPDTRATGVSDERRDLPVFGSAEGGVGGAMIVSSDPIQVLGRPDPLLTVKSGYGVFIVGESMSPAYEQGDIALVHPSLPPRRGADIVLIRREADGTEHALIKRLVRWTDKAWRVRQYNPAKEFDLARSVWIEARTIVGRYNAR